MMQFYYDFVDMYVDGVNNHFIHIRLVITVVHSTFLKVNRANGMRGVDCSDVERPLYQYREMDTDSEYIALAGDTIDDIVMPDPRQLYFRNRSVWLPAD